MEIKKYCTCKKCGKLTEVDASKVLTSNPPQYNYICEHCKNSDTCFTNEATWCISSEQSKQDVCVSKVSILESTKEELIKYKRAFEILKNNCHISNYVVDGVNSGKKITFDVIREWYDKEEYELLEELMGNER